MQQMLHSAGVYRKSLQLQKLCSDVKHVAETTRATALVAVAVGAVVPIFYMWRWVKPWIFQVFPSCVNVAFFHPAFQTMGQIMGSACEQCSGRRPRAEHRSEQQKRELKPTASFAEEIPKVEEPKPKTVILRSSADEAYVLCITQSGCKNGGWVHMWKYDEAGVHCLWELFQGELRPKANTKYALCVHRKGLANGGGLHLWEQKEEADVFGKWQLEDGVLRAEGDYRFCLCVTRNGCKDGGHVHMWSFDGAPADKYGSWKVEEVSDAGSEAGLRSPVPLSEPVTVILRSGTNDKYVLCITRNGCKNGGWVHMWKFDDELGVYSQWELFDGVLRSKADLKYVLCVQEDGLTNGGGLHMWEQSDEVNVFGKWRIADGAIRADADRKFCLCLKEDSCKDGGHLRMCCFDGVPPDHHGTWSIEQLNTDNSNATFEDDSGARLLSPVVEDFESALSQPAEILREPFVKGAEKFAGVLNQMGGGMGDYLRANTEKLRRSKADETEASYKPWLLSELPVHAENGYSGYVDDSAWMGNLWIAWTLEFFVELFAGIEAGDDMATAGANAYENTLSKHHSMFQRAAFRRALGQLPSRKELLKLLGQGASEAHVLQDIKAFVQSGRAITAFCLQRNEELADIIKNKGLGQ